MKKAVIWIVVAVVCGALAAFLIVTQFEDIFAPAPSSSSQPPVSSSEPAPVSSSEPAPENIRYIEQGELELPIVGATGYTLINTSLWPGPAEEGDAVVLPPGSSFSVQEESGEWWRVAGDGYTGWVKWAKCMVNLPDVIPSIVYDDTNAYSSVFLSTGKEIPGITGAKLYDARGQNERLGREEYIMPVLYAMSKRICAAQQAALAEGNTLVIIEAFRPMGTQRGVVQAVSELAAVNEEVNTALNSPPWGISWFIATGVSNHQQGYAVDLTLARVDASEAAACGPYEYTRVTAHNRYDMQTPIHELSPAAASMAGPIDPRSGEWRNVAPAAGMNDNAFLLQRYMTDAGMTPLASEWWHFNDYLALDEEVAAQGTGEFTTSVCHSFVPEAPGG